MAVLAVLIAPSVGGANPSQSTASLRAQDAAIVAKSRAAVLGLYSLDQQYSSAQSKLAAFRAQAQSLRAQRLSLRRQLAIARRSTRISQLQLAEQLRALYEQGNVEPLEIVLGSKSLDEAMTNLDNLNRVAGQGEDVLRQLASARRSLASASRGLAAQQAALTAATEAAAATAASLAQAQAQRSSYIVSLSEQRRLTERQISNLVAAAHAAELRSAQLTRSAATSPTSSVSPISATSFAPPPTPVTGGREITVSATGYALPGRTATGLPVGWGIVAVDPSVIPLGTHMTIPGYGDAVAADTGGAIIGATIDLWFPSVAQANAWGRRTVTIVLH
ncbi:MAG TPA: 3D domain-containing protein [Gaiellaceae bacterium]|nr:3D domain-containing protein [Gaiellaceae bacterium]